MILQDVVNRLDMYFPDIPINDVDIAQGVKLPCFFIACVNASIKREFKDRFWYDCLINVNYLSESKGDISKENIRDRLIFALETIPKDDGYIRAKEINLEKDKNDDLIVSINYSIFVRDVKDRDEYMRKLKQIFKSVKEEV